MSKYLKRGLSLLIIVAVLSTFTFPCFAAGDASETDRELSMRKLSVAITADKTSYDADEPVVFTVNVTNMGPTPVYDVKLVTFADTDITLETGSSSIFVGAIDSGNTAKITLNALPAASEIFDQESINAVFSSFGQVIAIVKMIIAFMFEPFMTNVKSCNVNYKNRSQGILCVAYGFTKAGTESVSDEPYVENDSEIDSDKDGLSDKLENLHGTNPYVADTDDDGFNDYQEVVLMESDPLEMNDPELDTDGDGLSDGDEVFTYHTHVGRTDTDGDGLSDYKEIIIYETDPTKTDTDGDGLTDGFEIANNLNPNKEKTNGVIFDGEIIICQILSSKKINSELLSNYNDAKPSISGLAKGEMNENISVELCEEFLLPGSAAVVGMPVDIIGDDEYLQGLTLSFDLMAYSGGLEPLVICNFDEEGRIERLSSVLSGGLLSCSITGAGTYFVLNASIYDAE